MWTDSQRPAGLTACDAFPLHRGFTGSGAQAMQCRDHLATGAFDPGFVRGVHLRHRGARLGGRDADVLNSVGGGLLQTLLLSKLDHPRLARQAVERDAVMHPLPFQLRQLSL